MTEKEIPFSSTPYQRQNFKDEPEDEINLLDMLGVLVRKKVLIFFTASIVVVLSMFYAFSVIPTYRATIGFQYGKSLISFFSYRVAEFLPNVSRNTDGSLEIKKNYILNEFIAELQSYSNQEKVFITGKFHERFVVNNPEIDREKEIIQEIHRSIHVEEGVSAKVASFEMKGVKPEVALDFLNALVDFAKSKAEFDVKESIQNGVKTQIAVYSKELNYELSITRQKNEGRIKAFTHNLEIAKNLGILDNNFDKFKPSSSISNMSAPISGRERWNSNVKVNVEFKGGEVATLWPAWYLYGQLALEQELNMMRGGSFPVQYSKKSRELNSKIEYLSNIDVSNINLEPAIIIQPSTPPVYPTSIKKINIIAIGIALGLFTGTLMALLSCLMTQLKERSKHSPPDFM
jgi:LPS O-antigen subunit length determinant protein (WzzB/FepE family)